MLKEFHQINIGKRRLKRYLQEMGITVIYPGPNLSKRNLQHRTYPYLLRNVKPEDPNHVWGIDLTYVGMSRGWMYLVIIIDWASRMIMGHVFSNTLHSGFIIEALRDSIKKHGKPFIINSDQGAQFTSDNYINFLKSEKIKISMNGRGRATDNAITERLIRTLKQEQLHLVEYDDGLQLRKIVSDYIAKYNWGRPHQSLNYQAPGKVYFNTTHYQHAG
jgi:putative transposase